MNTINQTRDVRRYQINIQVEIGSIEIEIERKTGESEWMGMERYLEGR